MFTNRYIGRADPYLQVLTAQTIALENERNDVDILRRRMDASVLLIKALGGSWNISQLPNAAEVGLSGKDQIQQSAAGVN
jgi:outer membrane protein TolC